MFDNNYGRKISNKVDEINDMYVVHQAQRHAPIKGGRKISKLSEGGIGIMLPNSKRAMAINENEPIMSGSAVGPDFEYGQVKNGVSKGATGSGKKGAAIWNEIEENLSGGALDRQIGGNIVESKGYEMEDPLNIQQHLLKGGALEHGTLLHLAESLVTRAPRIINPLIDKLPISDNAKSNVKGVVSTIADVVHAAAPILHIALLLHKGTRGSGKSDNDKIILREMQKGGALDVNSIKSYLSKKGEVVKHVFNKLRENVDVPTVLKVVAPIIGALVAAKGAHQIYREVRPSGRLPHHDNEYLAMREDFAHAMQQGDLSRAAYDARMAGYQPMQELQSDTMLHDLEDRRFAAEVDGMGMRIKKPRAKKVGGGSILNPARQDQNLQGNFTGGEKKKRAPSAWNVFVKEQMKKTGKSMKETLVDIKKNKLWKK